MIKIANAPCSWGVLEFELEGKSPDYVQVLNEIKETGYQGTELGDWGFMPTDPQKLHEEISRRDLQLLGAFVPVLLKEVSKHKAGIETALKTARLMKNAGYTESFIVLADDNGTIQNRTQYAGRIKSGMGLTREEWEIFCAGANELAYQVQNETGLRTVFHHHCAGYIETPEEIDMLMQNTNKNILGLVLDMGHYKFGGGEPLQALKKYSDRIWHVHFKDCHEEIAAMSRANEWDYFKSVKEGVFCELGKGSVDFKAIVDELDRLDYDGWIVVEQDVLPGMGKPKECAARNREYIRSLGL